MTTLEKLPLEMQWAIFVHLPVDDVARIAQTSRALREVVQQDDEGRYFFKMWYRIHPSPRTRWQDELQVAEAWRMAIATFQTRRKACQLCGDVTNHEVILPSGIIACKLCIRFKFVRATHMQALRVNFEHLFKLPGVDLRVDAGALALLNMFYIRKPVAMKLAFEQHCKGLDDEMFHKRFTQLVDLLETRKLHQDMLVYYEARTIWSRAFLLKWNALK
jgi:hypothetical protein